MCTAQELGSGTDTKCGWLRRVSSRARTAAEKAGWHRLAVSGRELHRAGSGRYAARRHQRRHGPPALRLHLHQQLLSSPQHDECLHTGRCAARAGSNDRAAAEGPASRTWQVCRCRQRAQAHAHQPACSSGTRAGTDCEQQSAQHTRSNPTAQCSPPLPRSAAPRPHHGPRRTCLCTRERRWLYFIALLQMSSKSRTTSCQLTYCRPRILPRITCRPQAQACPANGERRRRAPCCRKRGTHALLPCHAVRCPLKRSQRHPRGTRSVPQAGSAASNHLGWAPTSKHMGRLMIL